VRLGHTSIQSATRSIEMIRTLSNGNIVLALMGGDAAESGYYYYYSSTRPPEQGRSNGRFGRKKAPTEEPSVRS
jgi:hypothetical protein